MSGRMICGANHSKDRRSKPWLIITQSFVQLLRFLPRHEFEAEARQHQRGQGLRVMSRWAQFVALGLAQLTGRQSLRDIVSRSRRCGRPGDRRSRCGHTRGPAAGGSRSPSTIPDGGTSAGPRSCGRWSVPRCGRVARPRRSGAARPRPGPLWRAGRRRERGVETSARRDSYGAARVTSRRTR